MSGLIEFLRCRALQGALRKGRPGAVDELFELLADPLYRFACSITRQPAVAEEVLQDVFMQLVREPERLGEVRDIKAYLFRAVRNRALNHERQRAREVPLEGEALALAGGSWASETDSLALQQAVQALPQDQREVVVLKAWEGLSFREIAQVLDIPLNTAASRYRYALGHLRRSLSEGPREVHACMTTGI